MNKNSLEKNAEHIVVSSYGIFYQYSALRTIVFLFPLTQSFAIKWRIYLIIFQERPLLAIKRRWMIERKLTKIIYIENVCGSVGRDRSR